MRIQTNVINTIGIVLMIVLSVTAFDTFSFAANTNDTKNQDTTPSITTNEKTSSYSLTTNPVVPNTTTTGLTTGPSSSFKCTNTDTFLWNHVYGASGTGKDPWSQPGPKHPGNSRLTKVDSKQPCITVTGQVFSAIPGGTSDDDDGDLHFTLAVNKSQSQYTNTKDPECKNPSHGLPNPCFNIIVEVICHTTPAQSYSNWGGYCNNVNSVYPHGQFPKQGDKLTVSGTWVLDVDNGWYEIHPASKIITH
ncbi:MAG: hypothetical protein ACTHKC_05265 [Candidatus Nitrosocosmicus sp.]